MNEEKLIKQYELLIYKIAKRFYSVELSDLYQAGCIGLIKAARRYNQEKGCNFMTFAYKYIFGEMYELTNKSRDVKLNKYYLKIFREIEIAKQELTQKLKKIPSIIEISDYLELGEDVITDVVLMSSKMISLDEEYNTINEGVMSPIDYLGKEDNLDDKILINDSINELDKLERSVINCRFFSDLTQMETANALGISQVKVSRVEAKSKKKIKEYIAA